LDVLHQNDKSPAAIAALETAQADLRKIADASPLETNAHFTASSNGA
jgi:hypothetical protein